MKSKKKEKTAAPKKGKKGKKGGGMAGKRHPKDADGQTALAWTHSMRKAYPLADGGKVQVKFPDGPSGGTWAKTAGKFKATLNGEALGVFDSWGAARKAVGGGVVVGKVSSGKKKGKKRRAAPKANINGSQVQVLIDTLSGDNAKETLIAAASDLEQRAGKMTAQADAFRAAAETL